MLVINPYETTICAKDDPNRIARSVITASIQYPLPNLVTAYGRELARTKIITPNDVYDDVPAFTQPIAIDHHGNKYLALDSRPYTRYDRATGATKVVDTNGYSFQVARIALMLSNLDGDMSIYRRMTDVPAKTFIRWITLAVAQRYNLDMGEQLRLSVIAAIYFQGMTDPDFNEADDDYRVSVAPIIARQTMAPMNMVVELLETIRPMMNATDLAIRMSVDSGSVRLGKLSYLDIYNLVAASFIGVNSRENVGVALECPSTWFALVYTALTDRSYRKTRIADIANGTGRQNDLKQFCDICFNYVNKYLG